MNWIVLGALYCAAAVAAGAFGAHALEGRLAASALQLWETAARYLMYAGLALLAVGVLADRWGQTLTGPGAGLAIGGAIFSGTVFALALGGPRWLGAVTPIGGVGLIAGLLWLALAAWRQG